MPIKLLKIIGTSLVDYGEIPDDANFKDFFDELLKKGINPDDITTRGIIPEEFEIEQEKATAKYQYVRAEKQMNAFMQHLNDREEGLLTESEHEEIDVVIVAIFSKIRADIQQQLNQLTNAYDNNDFSEINELTSITKYSNHLSKQLQSINLLDKEIEKIKAQIDIEQTLPISIDIIQRRMEWEMLQADLMQYKSGESLHSYINHAKLINQPEDPLFTLEEYARIKKAEYVGIKGKLEQERSLVDKDAQNKWTDPAIKQIMQARLQLIEVEFERANKALNDLNRWEDLSEKNVQMAFLGESLQDITNKYAQESNAILPLPPTIYQQLYDARQEANDRFQNHFDALKKINHEFNELNQFGVIDIETQVALSDRKAVLLQEKAKLDQDVKILEEVFETPQANDLNDLIQKLKKIKAPAVPPLSESITETSQRLKSKAEADVAEAEKQLSEITRRKKENKDLAKQYASDTLGQACYQSIVNKLEALENEINEGLALARAKLASVTLATLPGNTIAEIKENQEIYAGISSDVSQLNERIQKSDYRALSPDDHDVTQLQNAYDKAQKTLNLLEEKLNTLKDRSSTLAPSLAEISHPENGLKAKMAQLSALEAEMKTKHQDIIEQFSTQKWPVIGKMVFNEGMINAIKTYEIERHKARSDPDVAVIRRDLIEALFKEQPEYKQYDKLVKEIARIGEMTDAEFKANKYFWNFKTQADLITQYSNEKDKLKKDFLGAFDASKLDNYLNDKDKIFELEQDIQRFNQGLIKQKIGGDELKRANDQLVHAREALAGWDKMWDQLMSLDNTDVNGKKAIITGANNKINTALKLSEVADKALNVVDDALENRFRPKTILRALYTETDTSQFVDRLIRHGEKVEDEQYTLQGNITFAKQSNTNTNGKLQSEHLEAGDRIRSTKVYELTDNGGNTREFGRVLIEQTNDVVKSMTDYNKGFSVPKNPGMFGSKEEKETYNKYKYFRDSAQEDEAKKMASALLLNYKPGAKITINPPNGDKEQIARVFAALLVVSDSLKIPLRFDDIEVTRGDFKKPTLSRSMYIKDHLPITVDRIVNMLEKVPLVQKGITRQSDEAKKDLSKYKSFVSAVREKEESKNELNQAKTSPGVEGEQYDTRLKQ